MKAFVYQLHREFKGGLSGCGRPLWVHASTPGLAIYRARLPVVAVLAGNRCGSSTDGTNEEIEL